MATSTTPRSGPSWRRVMLTLAVSFAVPALLGGIVGLVYAWRAQPLRAEEDRLTQEEHRSRHRFDQGGNLDEVLGQALSRKQVAEQIRAGSVDVDALRDLVGKLPQEVRLVSLVLGTTPSFEDKRWKNVPTLAMRLRVLEPPAAVEVIELLRVSGFIDPKIESSDVDKPEGVHVEIVARVPAGGTAETVP